MGQRQSLAAHFTRMIKNYRSIRDHLSHILTWRPRHRFLAPEAGVGD